MKAYRLLVLAIASLAMAAEDTTAGEQLTTLATVEVEVPAATEVPATETAATTDAPAATDTAEPESDEFAEDSSGSSENDVGTAVDGTDGAGLNITSEADLPAVFKGQADNEALLEEADPAESEDSSGLKVRDPGRGGSGQHRPGKVEYCFGPYQIFNIRFGATCPYYTRDWVRFHRKKLHVDFRVWQRRGRWWRPHWRKLANLQIARYTHRRRECGYVRDKITNHILFDACRWWGWGDMTKKLTKVVLCHFRRILQNAHWPRWLVRNVIGGTFWRLYGIIQKLRIR